jgi:hypothetical protein
MDTERLINDLGRAVVEAWGDLPRDVQETIFEAAVVAGHRSERDESLREQLAEFLHRHHPRTADGEGGVASDTPSIGRAPENVIASGGRAPERKKTGEF